MYIIGLQTNYNIYNGMNNYYIYNIYTNMCI